MELNEYVENKKEDLIEEKVQKVKNKIKKPQKNNLKEEVVEEEISDDEATELYKSLFNIILNNKKLRQIEDEEVNGIKSSIGNVTRILFKYLGGYKTYIDLTLISLTSYGIYQQRVSEKSETLIENKSKIRNIKDIEAPK